MSSSSQENWHSKNITEVFKALRSGEGGLDGEEALLRLKQYGPNTFPDARVDSTFVIFLRQFQSPLIYVLFTACAIVFLLGEKTDGFIILFVLLFNAVVGALQEGKAKNTLLALKKYAEANATVLRGGEEVVISDKELVPGDILLIREGEKVPADARIFFSNNLEIDEAAMTGESEPVHKNADIVPGPNSGKLPVSEQKNMIFRGSNVLTGSGKAVVVFTGTDTFLGNIAREIISIDTEIPLKASIRHLSERVVFVVLGITVALFLLGVFLGKPVKEMFITVVSLAVSIIPEGLPIVLTLILATGVWRMSKRNALVKKLQAVEALGQARVIAVDKTGTITKNELVVQEVYVNHKTYKIGGVGYDPKGEVRFEENLVEPIDESDLAFLGKNAAFCSSAHVMFLEEKKLWKVSGDPTEAAMLVFAEKLGFHKDQLEQKSPIVFEAPFNYHLKYHSAVHLVDETRLLSVSGAPEAILRLSEFLWVGEESTPLNEEERKGIESAFYKMSEKGLRVIAIAVKKNVSENIGSSDISGLSFVGLLGMKDALRPEVALAMAKAENAGIRVVMITGDHKITAQAIAKEAGIYHEGDTVLVGEDIDTMTDEKLSLSLQRVSVFARVTPEHKMRIIKAFKARGEIVAMTGDGVNDAPSLVAADLGVAMGNIGTDVAKEAADIILLDDNFGSIVSAVEEGRNIYKTIKRVILYLFSTSAGEVLTITGALLLGFPLPILAAQIIWLNLVTDGFLDVSLAMEPKSKGLLSGSFSLNKKYLVDRRMAQKMFLMALPMAIGTLFLFGKYYQTDIVKAWTVSLTVLAVFQWFNAWNCRSNTKSIFRKNPFSNLYLLGATFIVIILQVFAVYHPFFQKILHTTALSLYDWSLIIPVAFSIVIVEEIRKSFARKNPH